MTQAGELSIDFGSIVGGSEQPPTGSADAALTRVVNAGPARTLECRGLLSDGQRQQAMTAAKQLYPTMLTNTEQLATFGSSAIDQVNAQVTRIFREVGPVNIPELTQIMRGVNDRMRDFRRKYDPKDPKTRELFDKCMEAVKGVLRRGRDMVEMLFEDARTVERQLDRIAGTLGEKQQLRRNVVLCDELYKANEAATGQLIGAIAVMEMIRDLAVAEAQSITIDPAAPDQRDQEERRSRITEFIQAIEVRINEYQQRLFIAWSTSPQVGNIRTLNYGLGQRLALLVNLTIPTMKLTIAQWGLLLQANQAADMQQAVADGANDVLSAYASAASTAVPKIAKLIQPPTLRPRDHPGGRGLDRRPGQGHRGGSTVRAGAPGRGRDRHRHRPGVDVGLVGAPQPDGRGARGPGAEAVGAARGPDAPGRRSGPSRPRPADLRPG